MQFENNKYCIALDEKNGSINSLVSNGKEFVGQKLPLFSFQMRKGKDTADYTSDCAEKVTVNKSGDSVSIEYSGFENLDLTFRVRAVFSDRIEWRLSFENNTGMCVEWVNFPLIAVPDDLVRTGGSGRLLIDSNEGLIIEDMALKEKFSPYRELCYPSRGLGAMFPAVVQSQFMAYYDGTAGLYFAAEDPERSIKGVDFRTDGNGIRLQFKLYPGVEANVTGYEIPFAVVMDFFTGDWHSAAELYRTWFENNLPEGLEKLGHGEKMPEWYSDSPLIVTYPVQGIHDMDEPKPNRLFPYDNALPVLDGIAEETNSRIMALLMHWEGTAPWAPPYVWPPLGGEKLLHEFADRLHERKFLLGVYCSGVGYTIHSNLNDYGNEERYEKEGLKRFMCAPPDGSDPVSNICQGQRKSYDMCVSQDFTLNTLTDEAAKIATSDLDYIQILDQNHGGTPYFCFSDKHGHPPVPGKWMVEDMRKLLSSLKKAVGDKVLLGCESAASEAYIPYLKLSDNRFNINYHFGRPVPLYGYIYHEYLHNFSGNSVASLDFIDIKKSPDCHLMRIAYSFLAGDLITLVINQDGEIVWSWGERDFSVLPPRKPMMKFVKCATAYRRGPGKKYLVFGRMAKPCNVEAPGVPMYKVNYDYSTDYPAVLTTAWTEEDGGTKAQFLANYLAEDVKCKIDLSETDGAEIIDENGNVTGHLDGGVKELTVPASSVIMLLLKK